MFMDFIASPFNDYKWEIKVLFNAHNIYQFGGGLLPPFTIHK